MNTYTNGWFGAEYIIWPVHIKFFFAKLTGPLRKVISFKFVHGSYDFEFLFKVHPPSAALGPLMYLPSGSTGLILICKGEYRIAIARWVKLCPKRASNLHVLFCTRTDVAFERDNWFTGRGEKRRRNKRTQTFGRLPLCLVTLDLRKRTKDAPHRELAWTRLRWQIGPD